MGKAARISSDVHIGMRKALFSSLLSYWLGGQPRPLFPEAVFQESFLTDVIKLIVPEERNSAFKKERGIFTQSRKIEVGNGSYSTHPQTHISPPRNSDS